MPFGIGYPELIIIFLIILLLFGAKRIPDMAQGLGKGIKEFKKAMRDVKDEIDLNATPEEPPQNTIHPTAPAQSVAQQPTAETPKKEESKTPQQ